MMTVEGSYEVVDLGPAPGAGFFAMSTSVNTVVYLGSDRALTSMAELEPANDTLAMLRALDSVMIDDSQNEPPDFGVIADDGF